MKIAVVGPGALGCLYAVRFARAGHKVTLVDHEPTRASILRERGVMIDSPDGPFSIRIPVALSPAESPDLTLVLVKSHSTASAWLPSRGPVLTLQNGLGNAECIASRIGDGQVLAGVTYQAATLIEPGLVRHVAEGATEYGPWAGCDSDVEEAFLSSGLETHLVSDPREAIWRKAVINAAINPVSALLELPNGRIPDHPEGRWLLESLAREAARVAEAEGYPVLDAEGQAVAICRATSCNLSSMLQDRMAGRRSELEALTGWIVRRGKIHGMDISVSETVWNLVKAMEKVWQGM